MGLEVGVPVASLVESEIPLRNALIVVIEVGSGALIATLTVDVEDAAALDGVNDRAIECRR